MVEIETDEPVSSASEALLADTPAQIIVVGNEKGGSGKSTTAMHLIASLLHDGYQVGSIDLDAPQGTLSRYVDNRLYFMERQGVGLPMPTHHRFELGDEDSMEAMHRHQTERLDAALLELAQRCDFVVIDTPGSDSIVSRRAHSFADTLVTPLNDSFVDLDMLAEIDSDTLRVKRPSRYAAMVWEARKTRASRDGGSIDWIVTRNRMGNLESRNKQAIERVLEELARRIGFRLAAGFGERVIFRELFLKGLTLLDLRGPGADIRLNMSHLAARQEVRMLIDAIGLPPPAGGEEREELRVELEADDVRPDTGSAESGTSESGPKGD